MMGCERTSLACVKRELLTPGFSKYRGATMKPILIFLIVLVISWQSGCNESTEPTAKDVFVSLEVESAFQNDLVTLLLDDRTLLESRVTTNDVISLAWSSGLQKLSNGNHWLYFAVIEYGAEGGCRFDVADDTSTVTINFDKSTRKIRFQQYKGILLRD
jgi:hypothetical protein